MNSICIVNFNYTPLDKFLDLPLERGIILARPK
jgi:hypothetical protein